VEINLYALEDKSSADAANWSPADKRLAFCDSYSRPEQLVREMCDAGSLREAALLFLNWANLCDAPWPYRTCFAEILRAAIKKIRLADLLPADERAWLASLDPIITIYRGCEKGRERGLSWTTCIEVAKGFAVGKRCRNPKPTLVSAAIPKEYIFAVFVDRKENEIVVDPRRLRRFKVLEEAWRSGGAP
jgi:hypothetical protein